ncbi:hypothetical protein [Lacrimispora sp.]|uniref:hypothetical protein n=1 Tax=Lacrimispora sp. TaxID=2719234 RepID=UPI0028AFD40D|nr:hypothetical protein [Lacrimispora sp.]
MSNLYWPIYKNLEREVLNLADLIHFTDKQMSVYSVRIADILVRCSVEIESLINDLYKETEEKGQEKTVGGKLKYLNDEWKLEEKRVTITSFNMHFSDDYKTFSPFKYDTKDSDDYYSAYNAVKHDRAKNFETKATLHYLMRALSSLFVLNIYYKRKEVIPLGKAKTLPDTSFGSDIFTVHTNTRQPDKYGQKIIQDPLDLAAMYIIKVSNEHYKKYLKQLKDILYAKIEAFEEILDNNSSDENGNTDSNEYGLDTDFIEIARDEKIDSERFKDLVNKIATIDAKNRTPLDNMNFEAVLNKNQTIYHSIDGEEK